MSNTLPSIRFKLVTIVLACILPSLVGLGLLIFNFYEKERIQLEQDALQTVRALNAAVDRDLGIGENVALALATAHSLKAGNLAGFYARAKSLLRDEFPGFTFVLSDESGQQVLNTLRPFGEPLPRHGNPEQLRQVFETGKSVISDVYIGGVLKRPLVGIDVPIWRDGKVVYDLSVSFLPERLARILTEQHLPPGRIVAIFDSKGVIVARTHLPEKYVGQKGHPSVVQRIRETPEATMETQTLEGIPVFLAFHRSSSTGWTVAIGIPKATVITELLQSISTISLIVFILFVTGFGAALVLGGRIGRAVEALTAPVLALGTGKPVVVPPPYFREALQVATALKTVECELYGYRHRLEALVSERTAALHASTARLEQILEAAGEGVYGVDTENRLTFANRAAARILGWPDAESQLGKPGEFAIGHKLADNTPCTKELCAIRQTLTDRISRRVQDEFFMTVDGHAVPVEYVVTPHTLDGRVAGAVVVFNDITERLNDARRLVGAFNELEEQGRRLAANRDFVSSILDSVASHIAILEADGTIAEENNPWRTFARNNGLPADWSGVGVNYLTVCREVQGESRAMAQAAADGIEDVMTGRRTKFSLEYSCDTPVQKKWFQMRVTPLTGRGGRVVVCHDDITELKLAEAARRESVERLTLATRGAQIGIWDWNIPNNDLLWTEETCAQLGLPATENNPTLENFHAMLHDGDRERFLHEIGAAVRDEKPYDSEVRIVRRDGTVRNLKCAGQVFRDENGAPVRMVGITYDITERRRTEQHLSELLDLNEKIITECPVGIVVYKPSGECLLANEAFARIVGGTLDEVRSINFLETPSWKDAGLADQALAALATGEHRQARAHHITSFGREVWADVYFIPFFSNGESHLLCIKNDITDQTRSRFALAESERFIRGIADSLPGLVAYWDTNLRCRFANKHYLEWFNKAPSEMIGTRLQDLLGANLFAMNEPYVQGALRGELQTFERALTKPSGETGYTLATYIPDIDENGEIHGFNVMVADVTPLKQVEIRQKELNEQLVRSRDSAEAASRAKSEFVANMSHEIRTPMNAIMGLSRLLEDSTIGARERDYVTKIKLSAQSLLGILNDILDFSKIEAGRMEIEHAPFSLNEVLRNISAVVSTNAHEKGIETIFSVETNVPLSLVGDSLRLQQVLLNLTGNAVKFTNHGEVMLSIRKIFEDEAGVLLEFSVQDTGIGIPLEKQQGLFDAFAQADSSTSRRYGGTGLGLAISSRLAALMGGAITFTSQYGKGSDFRFTARFGMASLCTPGRPSLVSTEKLSVLVVDDNDTARTVLVHTCRSFRWHVEEAASATEGIALLRRYTAQGLDIDILLLDWRMPEIDGAELLRLAQADPEIRLPKVILMVTAFSGEAIVHGSEALPIDAVLAKPATPSALFDAVTSIRRGKLFADHRPVQSRLAGQLAGARLLLVEDNLINQQVAGDILLRAGAHVEIAGDGQTALGMLSAGADRFDAVLMDVQMPEMDGYETTKLIRSRLDLHRLPIIAMTANAMESDRRKSAEAGMNAHLAKPIDVDALIATLAAHIPGIGGNVAIDSGPKDTGPPSDQPDLPTPLPGIDLKSVLVRLGGNRRTFLSLMGRFEAAQGDAVSKIRLLLAEQNGLEAKSLLHGLRGVAANLGATEVARLAAVAEAAVKDGRHEEAASALTDLEAALAVVIETARVLSQTFAVANASAPPSLDNETLQKKLDLLSSLLISNDLKATDEFSNLRPSLELVVGREAMNELAASIDNLDFTAATAYVSNVIDILHRKGGA